jgi:microcystin-dependent protein
MAETETPTLKLIKPEIGGSNTTWGNRTNENWDKVDVGVLGVKTVADAALQRGGTDENLRTASEMLLYADAVQVPDDRPGAIVSQRWVRDLLNAIEPIGLIKIWGGSIATIPEGWALCNGQTVNNNVTPNLMDKFILGAGGTQQPGTTGGNATHEHNLTIDGTALVLSQIPRHNHGTTSPSSDSFIGRMLTGGTYNITGGGPPNGFGSVAGDYNGGNAAHTTDPHNHTGKANAGTTIPPFYALCYIMKVKLL